MEQRRRKIILWGTIALLAISGVFILWILHDSPPKYKGKTMLYWMEHRAALSNPTTYAFSMAPLAPLPAATWPAQLQAEQDCDSALRAIGAKSLPWITPLLDAHDSKLIVKLREWSLRQSLVKFQFFTAEQKHEEALWTFEKLGPLAESALPDLARILKRPDRSGDAAYAMANIGSPAVPFLIAGSIDGDPKVRQAAIEGLGFVVAGAQYRMGMGTVPVLPAFNTLPRSERTPVAVTNTTPILTAVIRAALHDPVLAVRVVALSVMSQAEPEQQPALVIPALIECAHDGYGIHANAIKVLQDVRIYKPVEAVPSLIQGVHDRDPEVQNACASILLRYGRQPEFWASNPNAVALMRRTIPALIEVVTNRQHFDEIEWVSFLSEWTYPEQAVSLLLEIIPRTTGWPHDFAVKSLGKLHCRPDLSVPVLTQELRVGDAHSQRVAALALREFGSDAKAAVPVLIGLLTKSKASEPASTVDRGSEEQSDSADSVLKRALLKIDPDAAAKAGIQ